MLDTYDIGLDKGDSPEAKVPLVRKIRTENRLGGAGNVALNLKSLNLNPILISVIGQDAAGEVLRHLCSTHKLTSELIIEGQRPTTVKYRIVDENFKQFLRLDTETTNDITMVNETKVIHALKERIKTTKIEGIVIQDYNKGVCTQFIINAIQEISIKEDIPIFVDPKHKNFQLLSRQCQVFKPNLKELSQITGKQILPSQDDISKSLKENNLLTPQMIFVTLSEKGIYYQETHQNHAAIIGGRQIDKADVSGAGDTVLSVLVWAYLKGYPVSEMARIANLAGAKVCSLPGISTISEADCLDDI